MLLIIKHIPRHLESSSRSRLLFKGQCCRTGAGVRRSLTQGKEIDVARAKMVVKGAHASKELTFFMHEGEIPEVVVCRLSLGNLVMRLWLDCMDNVRKLHRLLDEKDGDIVANNIPIALLGVKLYGETSNVTNSVSTTSAALNCRKAQEDWSLSRRVGKNTSTGDILQTLL